MKRTGSICGLAVFFLGIGLLGFTFFVAYAAFKYPDELVRFTNLVPISEEGLSSLSKTAGYVVAIALLFVMGSRLGGRIVKHGIEMYRARPSTQSDKEA